MTLCYSWISINRGLGKDVTHTNFLNVLLSLLALLLVFFKRVIHFLLEFFKVYNSSNTLLLSGIPLVLRVYCVVCISLWISNSKPKYFSEGKYHERKVSTHLQQLSSFRVVMNGIMNGDLSAQLMCAFMCDSWDGILWVC